MANPPPLPPIVSGPVYTTSKQVLVDSVLPNAKVTVYNDSASTHAVGMATSTSPGAIWVPLTGTIAHGQPITARQQYTGSDPKILVTGLSPPSTLPVPVLLPPTPLPAPIFASGLCTCMDWVYIDGLISGATLTITMGATTMVAAALVTQTPQWFQLAAHTIPSGSVLTAQQNIGSATSSCRAKQSDPGGARSRHAGDRTDAHRLRHEHEHLQRAAWRRPQDYQWRQPVFSHQSIELL